MMGQSLSGVSILLVDANRPVRTVIKTLLRGLGVGHVYEGQAGDEALVLAHTSQPDLVMVDSDLFDMSGVELTRRLRDPNCSPDAGLPIILLSGENRSAIISDGMAAGANAVLPKPINAATLGEAVCQVISGLDGREQTRLGEQAVLRGYAGI